ncbi:MAG TPA: MarR family transcriptional regulator [Terriglobales bacterium]|nr:MarR family transcriptional regulator [Terriglobales bacterium]
MKSLNSMTPAQIRILQYLKRVGASTPKQIASSLEVTPMAVHHQLAVLKELGLLATTLERRRAGRPSCLYSLSDEAQTFFPNEYGELVQRLLRSITHVLGGATVEGVFTQMKQEAVVKYAPRMVGKNLEHRVAEMAKIQSESGYMAESRRLNDNSFELTEHNCAILQVARNCSQTCECELTMMQELLGATVSRKDHIAKGDSCCRYLIQPASSP